MKLTKFGHCCLLIEENGLRILTDPGTFSTAQDEVQDIHVILITHEHPDHFHVESLKRVLANNPQATVITNSSVGALLDKEAIAYRLVEQGQSTVEGGVTIEGFGERHAVVHPDLPVVQNTGYFIAERLFYPGDAFTVPGKQVDILALPVVGPWMKISEAIDYALSVKPKRWFPVHDGLLSAAAMPIFHRIPSTVLEKQGISLVALEIGRECEL